MNRCLKDRTLLLLYGGEGTKFQRTHLGECDACTSRYNDLVRDLEAIGQTLRAGQPSNAGRYPFPRLSARWLSAGATLAIALLLVGTGVRIWTRSGLSPVDGNRNGETRSILDDLPANPFLTTEALAVELATEGSGSFDLAATLLEAERPCEWYDLPILERAESGSEALEFAESNSPASCVEISRDNEKRLPKNKSSKKFLETRTGGTTMKTRSMVTGIGTSAAASLLLVVLSAPVHAQVDAMTQARIVATFGLMSPRLLNALNLTPDQVTRIEAAKNAFRQVQRAYLNELRVLRKEVADKLFGANPVGEADVAAQITKIADLREKILREGFRIALDVRSVLRPDQLAKAAQIRQQLQEIQEEVRGLFNENQ